MEKRNITFDAIKIIGTNLIVFLHYQQFTETYFSHMINFAGGNFRFERMGELFFIISGMLAYGSMEKMKARGGSSFFVFYLKKMIRLIPMVPISYAIFQIGILIYYLFTHEPYWTGGSQMLVSQIISPWRLVLSASGMEAGWIFRHTVFTPSWYISVLLLCYCIHYFIEWVAVKINGNVNVLLIFMILMGMAAIENLWSIPFINTMSGRGIYCFCWGILFAKYIYYNAIFDFGRWKRMICILVLMGYWTAVIVFGKQFVGLYGNNYCLAFIIYPFIILLLKQWAYCHSYYISLLSKVSYEVFIFHFSFIALWIDLSYVVDISIHSFWAMVVFTLLVWASAFLLHFYCTPRVKKFVSYRLEKLL